MSDIFSFILKVLGISVGLAIAIKLLPAIATPTSPALVLAIVCFPTLLMAAILGWKATRTTNVEP
ncbi:MAG TPA: hypothetical protein V6C78_06055 [Crinalium sp.]|jgi:hypothetical protein